MRSEGTKPGGRKLYSPLKLLRRLQTAVMGNTLLGIQRFISRAPLPLIEAVSVAIGAAAREIMLRYRRVARINMDLVFRGEKTPEEKNRILSELFRNLGLGLAEYFLLLRFRAFPPNVEIRSVGEEHLKRALAQGRGVILASGHLGNFFILLTWLAQGGYPVNYITRSPKNRNLDRFLSEFQRSLGLRPIPFKPRRESARRSLACLRRNELLFLQLDQRPHYEGTEADFFGQRVKTFAGPEILVRRTGAVLLPVFIVRTGRYSHAVTFEPPIEPAPDGPEREGESLTQRFTRVLEKHILAHPGQWWWLHRRFPKEMYSRRRS